jgi:hypothetical protein
MAMDTYTACGLIEGFVAPTTDDPEAEVLAAWQALVDDGLVWRLQGFYGRTARALLDAGRITDGCTPPPSEA